MKVLKVFVLCNVVLLLYVVFVYFGFVLIGEVMLFILMFLGKMIGSLFLGMGIDLLFFRFNIGIGVF